MVIQFHAQPLARSNRGGELHGGSVEHHAPGQACVRHGLAKAPAGDLQRTAASIGKFDLVDDQVRVDQESNFPAAGVRVGQRNRLPGLKKLVSKIDVEK